MKIISTFFGVILGMVFVAGGLQVALETTIPTYQTWQAMKNWQPSSAHLLSVKESPNNVEANYGFSILSVEYSSNRIYVAPFKDNIGAYHHDLYQRLKALKDNNQPVSIWYDPSDPGQSVIDREMRWGLFTLITGFCSLFILSGFAIIFAVIRSTKSRHNSYYKPSLNELRKRWQQQRAENDYQGSFIDFCAQQTQQLRKRRINRPRNSVNLDSQPWLNNKEWRDNHIKSGSKKNMIASWIIAIIWMAVSSPLLFILKDEVNKDNYLALFGLIFPLAGLFLIRNAWKMSRQ